MTERAELTGSGAKIIAHLRKLEADKAALLEALKDLERAAQCHLDATDGSERQYLVEECANARAAIVKARGHD